MYSFGAMLSFTVAPRRSSALRTRTDHEERHFTRARTSHRRRGWPVFAVLGGLGTGIAFS
jgi:hypothetical protein